MNSGGPQRNVYLSNVSLEEALATWLEALTAGGPMAPGEAETVSVDESLGRVTAAPVFAALSSPHYHGAAMDGYAVRHQDTFGASEARPLRLKLGEEAVEIDTGDPLPPGYDAVIMIEYVDHVSPGEIEIISPATPWQHVRTIGEDIVATELILPENHLVRPPDLAAMLAGGLVTVPVHPQPRVAIIPTGSELVPPGSRPQRGEIIEFNSSLLAGMARQWGAVANACAPVPDDMDAIEQALTKSLAGNDVVIINAGSSAGREDFTAHVVNKRGTVLVHGVRIRPGKPLVLGIVDDTPVLGIPGFPVSAALDMELFARPVILALQGRHPEERRRVQVRVPRKIASPLGAEEFVRVRLGFMDDQLIAMPVERGAGALMSLVRADGYLRIP